MLAFQGSRPWGFAGAFIHREPHPQQNVRTSVGKGWPGILDEVWERDLGAPEARGLGGGRPWKVSKGVERER